MTMQSGMRWLRWGASLLVLIVLIWVFRDELGFLEEGFRRLSQDRKSTRLNSSHVAISYAVFCLKKKKNQFKNQSSVAVNPWIKFTQVCAVLAERQSDAI